MEKRILIASPVNEQEKIFKEYLISLEKLKIPNDYKADKFFILSKDSPLSSLLKENEYCYCDENFFIEKKENSYHNWTKEKYLNVGKLRSQLLEKARNEKYDYLFMVDSDVLIHPNTLTHLLKLNLPIVTEAVWTKTPNGINVADGQYEGWQHFTDKTYKDYLIPKIYEVNWSGIITLIHSSIFNIPTIDYNQIEQVFDEYSEDWSFFCKVYAHFPNFKLYMDTKYPGRHLYNESCYIRWMKEKEEYE